MRYSATTNNSASFVDQMMINIEDGSSSKKQNEYITQKNQYYSALEKPFEQVRKKTRVRLGSSYRTNKDIIVVTR